MMVLLSIFGGVALAMTLVAAASILRTSMLLGIGPVPTSPAVRKVMLDFVPAGQMGTLYELGSGFGGLARALAKHCPAAQVIAVEASWVPHYCSRVVQFFWPLRNLTLVKGNFYTQPLGEADLLMCYLFTGGMKELDERLRLKPGAWLISATFAMPGREPLEVVKAQDLYNSPVYLYRQNTADKTLPSKPHATPAIS